MAGHKCKVIFTGLEWCVLCPVCDEIAYRFDWGPAIGRALEHLRFWTHNG